MATETKSIDDDKDNQDYTYIDRSTSEKYGINLGKIQTDKPKAGSGEPVVIDVQKTILRVNDTEEYGLAFKSGLEGYVLSTRKGTYDTDNVSFRFTNDDGREQLVTDYECVLQCELQNLIVYHIPNLIIDNLQTGPTVVHIDTGEIYKYRAGVVQGQDDEHFIVYTNIKDLSDVSKCKIIFDDNSIVSCCGITKHQQYNSLLVNTADIPASINVVAVDQWMNQGDDKDSQCYTYADIFTGEKFGINLRKIQKTDEPEARCDERVVIDVTKTIPNINDTDGHGMVFKSGLESYVLSTRKDTYERDNVSFRFTNDFGREQLVTYYDRVLKCELNNMIVYHIPNLIIDNLQTGPTVVHIDTGEIYKYRAGVVHGQDNEHFIVSTNIKPDASKCNIIFDDNSIVSCCGIRGHQQCISLLVKMVDIPASINVVTVDQWMNQGGDNNDSQNYQCVNKQTSETFRINLMKTKHTDGPATSTDIPTTNVVINVQTNISNLQDTTEYGLAFKSGIEGYIFSTRKDIYDTNNVSFKFSNDDGREQLVSDYNIVLKHGFHNIFIYHIPNMIIDCLQTGPTIVHIDTGRVYKYRAGVVQSQNDEHIIVHTNIKNLPDASKCKIIFDDNSMVSCCEITKHQQWSSLLVKSVDIPASINVVTVYQWMTQLNIKQGDDKDSQYYTYADKSTGEKFGINLRKTQQTDKPEARSDERVVIDVTKTIPNINDTDGHGMVFKSGLEGYVLSTRKDTYERDNVSFRFTNDFGREQLVTDYDRVLKCELNNLIVYHIPNLIIDSLQTGPTVVHINTGEIYKYRAGVVQGQDNAHFIVSTNINHLPDASKCNIIFDDNSIVSCCGIRRHQQCISLLVKMADIPTSINMVTVEQWMNQGGDNNDSQNDQCVNKQTSETFRINLMKTKHTDGPATSTDIPTGTNVVIDVQKNISNLQDTTEYGLAFKSGIEGYIFSTRKDIYDTNNVSFKFTNDDGREQLVSDYNIVLKHCFHNIFIYHIPNMIIDCLQTGPTIVHIDTGRVYKYRAGVVQSQNDEHIIVHTNIKNLPDASKCKIIFDDNSIVSCCGITKHQQCNSLLVNMVDIPACVNMVTVDQWMKKLKIKQGDDKDSQYYTYADKSTGEKFAINLRKTQQTDKPEARYDERVVIDVTQTIQDLNETDGHGMVFKSGLEGYVSTRTCDTENVSFNFTNDDGREQLVTDYDRVLKCELNNLNVYHIPNLIIDSLQTGPTVVHIDTCQTYKYRAGVVQGQDDEYFIVYTNINHLPDASKCKIIFDDNSIVSCCGITKHQQGMSLLIKTVEMPASINVVTVEQWMKQFNKLQVPLNVDGREQSAVVQDTASIKSKERGPMTGEDLRRMEEVKLKLIDEISNPQPLCDYLSDEGILLPEDKHAIDMVDSSIKKTLKLLNLLIKECKGSFPIFVKGLKETHNYSLAKLLEDWPNDEKQEEINEEDKDFIINIKSKERGPMTGEDLRRMEEAKVRLIGGINDPQPICDYLVDKGILLPEDNHAINMVDSPIRKTVKLLNLLMKDCKGSFPVFVRALKETHHYSLAKLLEDWPNDEKQEEINEEDKDFIIKLEASIESGNIDEVEILLKQLQPDDTRRLSCDFIKLTNKATAKGNLPLLRCSLQSVIKHTHLTYAIRYHGFNTDTYIKLISLLIEKGVNINGRDRYGDTPLTCAIEYHGDNIDTCIKLISLLIKHGADINGMDRHDNSPLTCAILHHGDNIDTCIKLITLLIDHGADVNGMDGDYVIDKNVNTPLTCAILHHGDNIDACIKLVSLLIEKGVDINGRNKYGDTPLPYAMQYHGDNIDTRIKLISLLIKHGADINRIDKNGNTPLTCAILHHGDNIDTCIKLISLLIKHGADINRIDKNGNTPLTCAIRYYRDNIDTCIKLVSLLIKHGADINRINKNGCTPLTCAIGYHGDNIGPCIKLISLLMDHGADINGRDKSGHTPLTCAMLYHGDNIDTCKKLISLLIDHGAGVNGMDESGSTPLTFAIKYHVRDVDTSIKLIPSLIDQGADVNGVDGDYVMDKYGNTPLTCAIRCHVDNMNTCIKKILLLIEHGADVRKKDKMGITPLMTVAQCATHTDIVKLVLGDEDNVNSIDDDGLSACRYCFRPNILYFMERNYRTVYNIFQLLVESGADIVRNGVNLLHDILTFGNLQIFEYYIGLKSPVADVTDQTNENIFHLLSQVKYNFTCDEFNWLFDYGIDINQKDSKSNTPVTISGFLLNSRYLELLTKQSRVCDVNIQNKVGQTSLHAAVIACSQLNRRYKQAEIAELNRKVSRESVKEKSQTDPVTASVKHPGLQRTIPLSGGLQTNLHVIYNAFNQCLDIFTNFGGDVNIQDSDGKTALMIAAEINDSFIINKLLHVGAVGHIVDYNHGLPALQFLDLRFGRKCLTLLLDKGCTYFLNFPNKHGKRLIQRMLLFPWPQPNHNISFIRYLVAENCCLQQLQCSSTETNHYNDHVSLDNFNSDERHKLRQLLYRSGAPEEEIVSVVNFKMEDKATTTDEVLHSPNRERFNLFCFKLTLKEKCVRIIRQHIGLDIKRKVEKLDIPLELKGDILLIHYIPKRYFHDNIDDVFKDDDILDTRDENGFVYDDQHVDINSFIPQGHSNDVYNYKYYELHTELDDLHNVRRERERERWGFTPTRPRLGHFY